jgi:hypothetical protein
VAISLSALLLISAVTLAQVTVTLPNVNLKVGTTQQIPITVGDLTGKGVVAFQTTVTYDKTILKITGVSTTGTLSAAFSGTPTFNADTANGKITVVAAGTSALSSSGPLIYLTASLVGKGTSALTFSSFQFNEGTPAVTLTNGQVVVPSLSLKVSDYTGVNAVNSAISLPVVVDDITGQKVLSYQFTVTFDKTKINLTNATTTGTISSSMGTPTVNSATPGQLTVVAAGSATLTGSGPLVILTGTVVGSGVSTVDFTSAQFNEGTPGVAGVSGTISINATLKPSITKKMSDTTIAENQALSFTYLATDPQGGALTFSGTNLPSGAALTAAGVLTWTPSYTQSGVYSFYVVATNPGALKDSVAQKVTVTNVSRKPVFNFRVPATTTVISRNVATKFAVSATDPDGGSLVWNWLVNGVSEQSGTDSTFTRTFTDPHGTAKVVTAIFSKAGGLKDSTVWNFTITPVEQIVVPTEFALQQNYPNPFNPTTTISYSIPNEAPVTFEVYNVLGVKIRTLMAGQTKSAGSYMITWDGKNDAGVNMSSGIYLYRVRAGSFVASKKMTLLK